MMVDKGDSDDQLVEALRDENQRLRDGLHKMVQKQREDIQAKVPREARAAGVAATPTGASEAETEILRLNRLVKQQVVLFQYIFYIANLLLSRKYAASYILQNRLHSWKPKTH